MAFLKPKGRSGKNPGLVELCAENGMPLTKKRKTIIKIIEKGPGHMDAEDVYRQAKKMDPSIGIATVYRSLKMMRDFNVIDHHSFGQGHKHFESPTKSHHDHMICTKCGKIKEFADITLENLKRKVTNLHGFEMKTHRLEIYGICKVCRKKEETDRRKT